MITSDFREVNFVRSSGKSQYRNLIIAYWGLPPGIQSYIEPPKNSMGHRPERGALELGLFETGEMLADYIIAIVGFRWRDEVGTISHFHPVSEMVCVIDESGNGLKLIRRKIPELEISEHWEIGNGV